MKLSFKPITFLCLLGTLLPASAQKLSIEAIDNVDDKGLTTERKAQIYSTQFCSTSASIQCFVTGTNTPCDQIGVQPYGTCGPRALTVTYEYCNRNAPGDGKIVPLKTNPSGESGTIAMYRQQWGRPALNLTPVAPGVCQTVSETAEVDTCRRMIVAELKFEGWVDNRVNEDGYYCYAWKFLSVPFLKAEKPPETPPPSPTPAANISLNVKCTYVYYGITYECSDSDKMLSFGTCQVPVTYQYTVVNEDSRPVRLDALLNNDLLDILETSVILRPNSSTEFFERDIHSVNLCADGRELVSYAGAAVASPLSGGGEPDIAQDTVRFPIPILPFELDLISVGCVIDGTEKDCNEYVKEITSLDQCEVDIMFKYTFSKQSLGCLDINHIISTLGPLGRYMVTFEDRYACMSREICNGDSWTVPDRKASVNVCTDTQGGNNLWDVILDVTDKYDRLVTLESDYRWALLPTINPAPVAAPVAAPVSVPNPSPMIGIVPTPVGGVKCNGRPDGFSFKIVPIVCSDSQNSLSRRILKPGKGSGGYGGGYFTCSGAMPAGPMTLTLTNKYGRVFYQNLSVSANVEYQFSNGVPSNTVVMIRSSTGTQEIHFHSSCSKPIYTGDTFGSFMITGFIY